MSARAQTERSVGLSHLLLVLGLEQTEDHLRQGHASSRPHRQVGGRPAARPLAAHGADEVGADFPLTLAHLQRRQRFTECGPRGSLFFLFLLLSTFIHEYDRGASAHLRVSRTRAAS